MSAQVGTSSFPERLRCEAYAVMKASALNPKPCHPEYMVERTTGRTHLMSRTPGMAVEMNGDYLKAFVGLRAGGAMRRCLVRVPNLESDV